MDFHHISVLYNESIEAINIKPNGTYVDATLGGAGHSLGICQQLSSAGRLIGIDQDISAINAAKERLEIYKEKIILVNDNFRNIKNILKKLQIEKIDGVIMDLGVSSHQLDSAERGFSYQKDAPLDMRMDTNSTKTAYEIVNNYTEDEITSIIYKYGEERWAKRIASFIVAERKDKPVSTTLQLVDVIKKAVPSSARREGPHPAKRTFQAIRIAVNDELLILEEAVKDFVSALNKGGRIAVITFHSLEDRIIKNVFGLLNKGCVCPSVLPICVCGNKPLVRLINKKPIIPSEYEVENNPRSRSAKLRIVEKI